LTVYKAADADAWNAELCFQNGSPKSDDGSIYSIFQTGLERFGRIRLSRQRDQSVAGYVASERKLVNISNVRDAAELSKFAPQVTWLPAVDEKTGFRSVQMLCAPILGLSEAEEAQRPLIGVVQLINHHDGSRFPSDCERSIETLCEALSHAFSGTKGHTLKERQNQRNATLGALAEGPPADHTAARASLLQHYRDRSRGRVRGTIPLNLTCFNSWAEEDVRDLECICILAETGETEARDLQGSVLNAWNGRAAAAFAGQSLEMRALLEDLGKRFPQVAYCLASFECRTEGRASRMASWFELAGPSFVEVARLIRGLHANSDIIRADEAWCMVGTRGFIRQRLLKAATEGDAFVIALQDLCDRRRDLGVEQLTDQQMATENILDHARFLLSNPDHDPLLVRKALQKVLATGEEAQQQDASILLRSMDRRVRGPNRNS
jgi:hypothetical protein